MERGKFLKGLATLILVCCIGACAPKGPFVPSDATKDGGAIQLDSTSATKVAIGKRVRVSGIAEDYDGGAFVMAAFQSFRITGITFWPSEVLRSRVVVEGTLAYRPEWRVSGVKLE